MALSMASLTKGFISRVKSKISSSVNPCSAGRVGHGSVVIDDHLYLWGGYHEGIPCVHESDEKKKLTSTVYVFSLDTGYWEEKETNGDPPLAISGYACAPVGLSIYYFGGDCGHENCYHNSITQLDTTSLIWSKISSTTNSDTTFAPTRKTACGMIHVHISGDDLLYVFGGYGLYPSATHPPLVHQYIVDTSNGLFRNNEQHIFNLTTNQWSVPFSTGQSPPPINTFTLTAISGSNRAVLFGGRVNDDVSSDLYICTISGSTTVDWIRLTDSLNLTEWPLGRRSHSASYFVGSQSVVIVGGEDQDNDHVKDCWLLYVNSLSWRQVHMPEMVTNRSFHSSSLFTIGPRCVWLMVTGGIVKDLITGPAGAAVIEIDSKDNLAGQVLIQGNEQLVNYQGRLIEQLKRGRRDFIRELTKTVTAVGAAHQTGTIANGSSITNHVSSVCVGTVNEDQEFPDQKLIQLEGIG